MLALSAWLAAAFFVTGFAPGESAAWSADIYEGPTTARQGSTIGYSVEIRNTGATALGVYYVFVHFDWQPTDIGWVFLDRLETLDPVSVAVSSSQEFPGSIDVPSGASVGAHTIETTIVATVWDASAGSWDTNSSAPRTFTGSFEVTGTGDNALLLGIVVLVGAAAASAVGLVLYLRRKKRAFIPPPTPPAIRPPTPPAAPRPTPPGEVGGLPPLRVQPFSPTQPSQWKRPPAG